MNKNEQVAKKISQIGDETFEKLKNLQVLPYPKYYHDTFMDIITQPDNKDVLDLSKKYNYLFLTNDIDNKLKDSCFNLTKESLLKFKDSNTNLKKISENNTIDIDRIKKEPDSIDTNSIIESFDRFHGEIVKELDSAEQTIQKLKTQIEKLERESNIDPLTKTYNRRALTKDLEEILDAGKDKNLDMQLIIFDIDDFKKINDTFGHIAGDKTLIYITRLMQNSLRKGVRIYRYGGEEFVILLNRSDEKNCARIVNRIIKNTDESKLIYKEHYIHLTISAGISKHIKNDNINSIIDRADSALYLAKSSGKNCFKVG